MNRPRPPVPRPELDQAIQPWEELWQRLRGRRVFLTGGTGTVGAWLMELFCRANARWNLDARAVLLSRHPAGFQSRSPHLAGDPAVSFLEGDIRTFPDLPEGTDFVIHGAAEASGGQVYDDLQGRLDTLVLGTRHLLGRMLGAGTRRVLLLSSGVVYGPQPDGLEAIPEDYPGAPDCLDPGTRYAQGKRLAEHYCAVYKYQFGLEPVIARGFALAGPYVPLDAHFAMGNFIRDALAGGPIRVQGDGTPVRSYLYGADYAMALWLCLLAGQPGRAYNVGSSEAIPVAALARRVAAPLGLEVVIENRPTPSTPGGRYVPSDLRIRRELGFSPNVPLDQAIQRTLDWYGS